MLALERTVFLGAVMLALASCTAAPEQIERPETVGESNPGSTTEATSDATATGMADGADASGTTGEPATTMPLDATATTGDPSTGGSAEDGPMTTGMETTGEPGDCHPLLSEVLYDPSGGNNNKQWIELYNPCPEEIVLTDTYSLGWGGDDYAAEGIDLVGAIASSGCFVVGGPNSDNSNANPVYDQNEDLHRDPQTAHDGVADGVALFDMVEGDVTAETLPIDAVIYGDENSNGLLDPNGDTPVPHVQRAPEGQSIRRTARTSTWIIEPSPAPNDCMPM